MDWPAQPAQLEAFGEALRAQYGGEGPVFEQVGQVSVSQFLCRETESHCEYGLHPIGPYLGHPQSSMERGRTCSDVCIDRVQVSVDAEGRISVARWRAQVHHEDMPNSPFFLSRSSYSVSWSGPERSRRAEREVRRVIQRKL